MLALGLLGKLALQALHLGPLARMGAGLSRSRMGLGLGRQIEQPQIGRWAAVGLARRLFPSPHAGRLLARRLGPGLLLRPPPPVVDVRLLLGNEPRQAPRLGQILQRPCRRLQMLYRVV